MFGSLGLEIFIAFTSLLLKRLVKSLTLLSSVLRLSSPVAPLGSVVTENVKSFTTKWTTNCVQVIEGFSISFSWALRLETCCLSPLIAKSMYL